MTTSYSIEDMGILNGSRVMIVYPHPDDETFSNAGLIQKLRQSEVNIRVLCLTEGEASTLTFGVTETKSLREVRREEFEQAMKLLNVKDYLMKDYTDGGLKNQVENLTSYLKEQIKEFKPKFVVTYEPCGVYGHPDHILVSKIITDIAEKDQAETGSFKIIYSTIDQSFKFSESSLNMADNREQIHPAKPNFILRLTLQEYFTKIRALRVYKSQISMKHEFLHKIWHMLKIINEYYFLRY